VDLTDEALIESFRKTKDSNYFKSLARRYQNRIYNAAFRILGNGAEAEEVVQETYIKVHHNLNKFRRQCSVGAWIFAITHNICMDILRTRQRKSGLKLLSFESQASINVEGVMEPAFPQPADQSPTPPESLDLDEQADMIQQSLDQLPESQRAVVVLHDIEGFEYQEIAQIVGTSVGTVRSRLHYGRLRLRQLLEPYFSGHSITPAPR
jgi:RNA polymerase sigma-70 factor (ECF subfamily)